MAPRRTIDFLHWARDYHQRLRDFYAKREQEATRPEVCTLLEYMWQHQEILAQVIDEYEKEAPAEVLDSWFKVSPDPKAFRDPETAGFRADMTTGEVVDLALNLDQCLRDMYRVLVRDAESTELREMLENLLAEEEGEEVKLLRSQVSR